MKNKYKTKDILIKELEISEAELEQAQEKLEKQEKDRQFLQKQFANLSEVCTELSKADTFDDLCRQAVQLGCNRLGFDRLGIWLIKNGQGKDNRISGSFGIDETGELRNEKHQQITVNSQSPMGQFIDNKLNSLVYTNAPLFNDKGKKIDEGSQTIATIRNGKGTIGYICMDNLFLKLPINDYHSNILNLYASLLGHMYSRKQAEEETKKNFVKLRMALGGTIEAMARILEMRDPYTAGHQRRVANLARAIATEMGLPEKQINGIRIAGSIHDIGKISIPSEILSKPTRLNEIEFRLVKTHAQKGFDILKTIDFPWPVANIVSQHHERINGAGYPQGLPNENILLEAKILAVADTVEAMASHRPYRPALGIDEALKEILKNSGKLYDTKVVNACLKLFRDKNFMFTKK